MKHDPSALWRAMAKGLDTCRDDDGARYLAVIFRAMSRISMDTSAAGDDRDVAMVKAAVLPMLSRAPLEMRQKVLLDLLACGLSLQLTATGLEQELERSDA